MKEVLAKRFGPPKAMKSAAESYSRSMPIAKDKGTLVERLFCHSSFIFIFVLISAFTIYLGFGRPKLVNPTDGQVLKLTNGKWAPTDAVSPGDDIVISWTQDWKQLCSADVTRYFVDSIETTPRQIELKDPRKESTVIIPSPAQTGIQKDVRTDVLKVPPMIGPKAKYVSIVRPRCWTDWIWPREFASPGVEFQVHAQVVPNQQLQPNKLPGRPSTNVEQTSPPKR